MTKEERISALRARANDTYSLSKQFGPTSGKAVRAVLLTLADIEEGTEELVHKPEPVVKRDRV